MTLNSSAIASGIAALSVSGVTIKDITDIPQQIQPRDCPIMFPSPNNWKAGGSAEPSTGPASFGSPTGRFWLFDRTYKYIYLNGPVGEKRGIDESYSAMSGKEDLIVTALTTLDLAEVDVMNISVGEYGVLQDPAGGSFYGFTVSIILREYLNA